MTRNARFTLSIGRSATAIALTAIAFCASAQQATSPPRPPGAMPPPLQAPASMQSIELQGQVARWLTNPNGDVDGLILADGTQVGFPPHLSSRVVDAVKLNDNVKLKGWREGDAFHAAFIQSTKSGRMVADEGPPTTPPTPPERAALQEMSASGRIATQLRGPRGEVNGVVLQSGELVRFPPHIGMQNQALLQKGATLAAKGYGTRNSYGVAFEATALGPDANNLQPVFEPPRPPIGDAAPPPPPLGANPAMRPAS